MWYCRDYSTVVNLETGEELPVEGAPDGTLGITTTHMCVYTKLDIDFMSCIESIELMDIDSNIESEITMTARYWGGGVVGRGVRDLKTLLQYFRLRGIPSCHYVYLETVRLEKPVAKITLKPEADLFLLKLKVMGK